MLDLVARRLREILHARFVVILLRSDGDLRLEAAAGEVDVAVGSIRVALGHEGRPGPRAGSKRARRLRDRGPRVRPRLTGSSGC